ncbi:thioredoxin-like domain-containing protein [Flavobacterium sp.]|jgi:thiol-disulfide isomerase/thioredoxin|uniref:thioredoxin-like domain-containing protein n=1 Tax=Flavobacterium sp. TaxID=239 RepID=UPI0037BEC8D5
MKKIIATLALGLGLTSCQAQTEFSKESLTAKLINIENQGISFEEILKQNEGKTVVIEVWASWCSDCIKSMPQVKDLKEKYKEVAFINLSCDKTFDAWKSGIEKFEVSGDNFLIPDGMKGEFGTSIKLDWIPRFIVINKDGKIVLFRAIEKDFDKIIESIETSK